MTPRSNDRASISDSPETVLRAQILPVLSEKLFTHYVGGAWRAPLATRSRPVRLADGTEPGQIVLAGPADIARAHAAAMAALDALADPVKRAQWCTALEVCLAEAQPLLDAAHAAERHSPSPLHTAFRPGIMPRAPGRDGTGNGKLRPQVLLAAAGTPPDALGAAVRDCIAAGQPVILKPAPGGAVLATVLIDTVAAARLPPGAVCMLQGDGPGTGALLYAHPGLETRVLGQVR